MFCTFYKDRKFEIFTFINYYILKNSLFKKYNFLLIKYKNNIVVKIVIKNKNYFY